MSWIRVTLALLLVAYTAIAEVVHLTDADYAETVNSENSLWFINFNANWCPWSIKLAPAWEQLGNDEEVRKAGVRIGAVDCATSVALCREANIQGYPTLRIFFNGPKWKGDQGNDGDFLGDYYGERDVESLKAFALEKQAKLAPHKITAATAEVNSTREEAPQFSVGMLLKLLGF